MNIATVSEADLLFGRNVGQVFSQHEAAVEGRLRDDEGGEAHALAHVGQAGQQEKVARENRRQELKRQRCRVQH